VLSEGANVNGTPTVVVTVKDVYGNSAVYPASDAAHEFARIAKSKTLTLNTIQSIRTLGFAIEVLAGELPRGW
jgi:hypothetical protein